MSDFRYKRSEGKLTWGTESYTAVSGPHGKGQLPNGTYTVKTRNVVTGNHLSSSFRAEDGNAWFIPIEPVFSTNREGLGIHPDGGISGTLGCIGLTGNDAVKFWSRWNSLTMGARPISLVVE